MPYDQDVVRLRVTEASVTRRSQLMQPRMVEEEADQYCKTILVWSSLSEHLGDFRTRYLNNQALKTRCTNNNECCSFLF